MEENIQTEAINEQAAEVKYTSNDYKKGQPRWCPGCGDHGFLNALQKAMAEIGVAPYETAVISGIGCSSRLRQHLRHANHSRQGCSHSHRSQNSEPKTDCLASQWRRRCTGYRW